MGIWIWRLAFLWIRSSFYQRNHLECLALQHAPSSSLIVLSEFEYDLYFDGQHSRVEQLGYIKEGA
jgi:hypothetical protein